MADAQQFRDAGQFDPRTAVRLTGRPFVLVDQLPVVVSDQLRLPLQQPLHQLLGVVLADLWKLIDGATVDEPVSL